MSLLPVYEKDDFLFFKKNKDIDENDGLIIDESRINLISEYMQTKKLKNIIVNSNYFPVKDLTFLKCLGFVQSISIADNHYNIQPVNDLHELREIRIGDFKGSIDFNNFPHLMVLGTSWSTKLKNLENSTSLSWLWLENYRDESLDRFKNLKKLSYLHLYKTSIKTLNGMEGINALTELHIDTAGQLESLDGINQNNLNLRVMDIFRAPKLTDYNALKYLLNLENLRFTKTGDMQDIYVLRSFSNLKRVILGIKVLNGDMILSNDIDEYKFLNFPHYNLKSK
jgi:hypothetical protein